MHGQESASMSERTGRAHIALGSLECKERILQHLDWLNADPRRVQVGLRVDDLEAA